MFYFFGKLNILEVWFDSFGVACRQVPRMKNPNPFYLGTLRKLLTERESEDMFSSIKWVTCSTYC